MTIDEFCAHLDAQGHEYTRDGNAVSAGDSLYLDNLTTLPKGVTLAAGGSLYLRSLTALPEGVTLSAGGTLDLESLTALPEGVTLSAGGTLDLRSLTALGKGVTLSAGDYLDLESLTALPEGVTLSAGGTLYLRSLTNEVQSYQGRTILLSKMDGYTMRLISKHTVGGVTIWSAQYFKGHLDTDPRCYIAQDGDLYAHGETIPEAIRDLRFKVAQRDFDPAELAATIKDRGTVKREDFRLITGACESGLRMGMADAGLDPDADELPLSVVLQKAHGPFGDAFREALA